MEFKTRWDSNPRYFINTTVFKTVALNHSATYPVKFMQSLQNRDFIASK